MEGDFSFDASIQDLKSDAGLETAVIISLFTDRRAKSDDILPDSNNPDRRGWWGDLVSDIENDQIGSRLWLLNREKTLESVLIKTKEYAKEALMWLIEDDVATKVEVSVERLGSVGQDILALLVQIYKPDGKVFPFQYEAQWIAQELR
ncbi:MAG: phage GP46 family protein [Deltaproteobacteria bacterium]|nr:phage GP46 family protein [Deltaproteobacteria bacterium]